MPKRAARLLSVVFVTLLAGVPFTTSSHSEPAAEDRCLSAPKGGTPAGSHWYYRFDRAAKRNCWHLRPEGGDVSQVAPQNILPAGGTPVSRTPSRGQSSVADARAEVRARSDQQEQVTGFPATPATPREAPLPLPLSNTAVVASRWPELPAMNSTLPSQPTTAGFASVSSRENSGPPPGAAALAPLAAAASAVPGEPGTIRNLIAATLGVLALAGITAVFLTRRGYVGRLRRSDVRYAQGPIWETTDDTRIVLSPYPSGGRDYRPRFGRSTGESRTAEKRTAASRARKPYSQMSRPA